VVFVERGLSLLNQAGRLGYILPSKFFATDYGASLRGLLAREKVVGEVIDFGHAQVFDRATTYTCLLFLDRACGGSASYLRVQPSEVAAAALPAPRPAALTAGPWLFMSDATASLSERILVGSTPLLSLPASISRGSSTGDDGVFCLETKDGELRTRAGETVDIEAELVRRPLWATDFTRYEFRPRNEAVLIFPYRVSDDGYSIIPEAELHDCWPRTYAYLRSQKPRLEKRRQYKEWYGFSAPRNLHVHDRAQMVVPVGRPRTGGAPGLRPWRILSDGKRWVQHPARRHSHPRRSAVRARACQFQAPILVPPADQQPFPWRMDYLHQAVLRSVAHSSAGLGDGCAAYSLPGSQRPGS